MELSIRPPPRTRCRRDLSRQPPAVPGGTFAAACTVAASPRCRRNTFTSFSRSLEEGEEKDVDVTQRSGRNRPLFSSRSPADERRLSGGVSAACSSQSSETSRLLSSSMAAEEGEGKFLRRDSKKELSNLLREEAAIGGVERKAVTGTSTRRLWPKAVLGALDDAVRNDRWESALQIFSLLRKQKWYNPKGRTYARLLMMLGRCGQPKHASFLFQILLSEGLRPTPDVYTALISAYGRNSLWDEAFALIDEMKSIPSCRPDVYTYTILIDCLCKLRRFDLLPRAIADMKRRGISPNVVTHNTIIDGFGKAQLLEDMENSLVEMIESEDCLPDHCTMNSILWAYGDCGRMEEMERSYDEFLRMGVEPDTMTFNILIRSYGRAGMQAKMCLVMDFMKKRFFSPTVVTFNSMIDCFGRAGNIEKMEETFRMMKFQGVKPNPVTYCSVVSGYSRAGLLEKIPLILRQTENSDVKLDTAFFNCVINAYGEAGELEIMAEMFLLMREKQCKPDRITLTAMVQAYSRAGMSEAAETLEIRRLLATAEQ